MYPWGRFSVYTLMKILLVVFSVACLCSLKKVPIENGAAQSLSEEAAKARNRLQSNSYVPNFFQFFVGLSSFSGFLILTIIIEWRRK